MKWIIQIAIIVFSLQIQAQNPLYIHMAEDGIHLRWQGVRDANFQGYNVHRKTGNNGSWELLTSTPLSLVQSSDEAESLSGTKSQILYGLLEKTGGAISAKEIADASQGSQFFESLIVINPELAWMLGERFTDLMTERGIRYAYRITWLDDNTESEWQESILQDPYQPESVPGPETINTEEGDSQVTLNMSANQQHLRTGDAITWNVYRSETRAGPFEKINFENFFPLSIETAEPTLSFTDRFLSNGNTYHYRVKMVNVTGHESDFSKTYSLTPRASTRAGILNFTAEILASQAILLWEMEQPGKDIRIWRQDGPNSEFTPIYTSLSVPGISRWIDEEFTPGIHYHYFMTLGNGNDLTYSDTLSLLTTDIVPPPIPTGLKAVVVDSQFVRISWNRSPAKDIAFYEVERLRSAHNRAGLKISGKNFKDTVLVDKFRKGAEGSNFYRVFAIDNSYNYSKGSELVQAKLPDISPPQSPNLFTLRQVGDSILFRWSELPDQDLAYFEILRGKWSGELEAIGQTQNTNYLHQAPDSGKYIYSVAAVDTSGNKSEIKDTLSITVKGAKPSAPSFIGAEEKGSGLLIQWEELNNPDIKRIMLSRINPVTGNRLDIWQGKATTTEFLDKYADPEKSWKYELQVYDQKWRPGEKSTYLYEAEDEK